MDSSKTRRVVFEVGVMRRYYVPKAPYGSKFGQSLRSTIARRRSADPDRGGGPITKLRPEIRRRPETREQRPHRSGGGDPHPVGCASARNPRETRTGWWSAHRAAGNFR